VNQRNRLFFFLRGTGPGGRPRRYAVPWGFLLAAAVYLTLAAPARGQVTITINPGVTHQTWRGLSSNIPGAQFGVTGCPKLTTAQMDTLLNELVNDMGMTAGRYEWYREQNLEMAANDNLDPSNINLSGFQPAFTAPINQGSGCSTTADNILKESVVPFRNKVAAAGQPVEVVLSFVNYHTAFTQMPLWWQNGTGSSGTGAQEAAEAFHAVLLLLKQNYGFYPEFVTWNEPQSSGFWSPDASPGGAANWLGGWAAALHDRLAAAGIPTKIELPENADGASTVLHLNAIGLVPNALADLGRITWHCYSCPSTTDFTGILAIANSLGKETGMTETGAPTSYLGGQDMLDSLYRNATLGNVSVWHELASSDLCSNTGCDASTEPFGNWIMWEPNLSTYYKNPHYWVIRQFGHYVKPGYVRVDATSTNPNFESTAWKRPDGTLVVVVHVYQVSGQTVTVNGLPASRQYNVFKLDPTMCSNNAPATNRCTPTATTMTTSASGSLSLAMPTNAVWTLADATGSGSGTSGDFSLTATPGSMSVTAGGMASYTLNVTPTGGFNQAVSLNCSGAPPFATCNIQPGSVTLNGSSASSANVTVTTAAGAGIVPGAPRFLPQGWSGRALPWLFWACAVAALAILGIRRLQERSIRLGGVYLGLGLLLAIAATTSGCTKTSSGGGGGGSTGTPRGTFTLTISGSSGSLGHSTTVTLTVN
jgi:hypothetical protein